MTVINDKEMMIRKQKVAVGINITQARLAGTYYLGTLISLRKSIPLQRKTVIMITRYVKTFCH